MALAAKASQIYVARGKKVVQIDIKKDKPEAAVLSKLLLGPTGNLRAPALLKGKTLVVGFHQEMYESVFGQ